MQQLQKFDTPTASLGSAPRRRQHAVVLLQPECLLFLLLVFVRCYTDPPIRQTRDVDPEAHSLICPDQS